MLKDIVYVKDKYGEEMSHFVRDNFSTILETEGLIVSLLDSNFAPNKFLYQDLVNNDLINDFCNYINGLTNKKMGNVETNKTPFELLDDAGYKLYECKTIDEVESFKKFYAKNEELCTFKGNRLKKCHVFFAVKKNINDIVRSADPKREDEYGTSVISIQFSKGDINTLSIKNRYNHTVKNPDATFGNNLDNIIPGLTDSFTKKYNFNIISNKGKLDITHLDYKQANDYKFYPYNYEYNNIYYGMNNTIIDNGRLIDTYSDRSRYIIIDYFILDLSEKKMFLYDESISDSFINSFNKIEKVSINKTKYGKQINIINDGKLVIIKIDKQNRIISYENKNDTIIENNFLILNKTLENIDIPNVTYIGNNFLYKNENIKEIFLPKIQTIKNNFLNCNSILNNINVESATYIGDNFLYKNENLKNINLPNVISIGNNFILCNNNLEDINIENVTAIGNNFLWENRKLKTIKLNNANVIGDNFLTENEILEYIYAPKLEIIGNSFLYSNLNLKRIELEKIKIIGDSFLNNNNSLKNISVPIVQIIGKCFLLNNNSLININLKSVEEIGMNFMYYNKILEDIRLDKIEKIENNFLYNNLELKRFVAPNLKDIWDNFMYSNQKLIEFNCPSIRNIGDNFLYNDLYIIILSLNNLYEVGNYFMNSNRILAGFDALALNRVGDNFLYSNINLKHYKTPNLVEKGINYLHSNPEFRHTIQKRKSLKLV